jgi:hypothetical protein
VSSTLQPGWSDGANLEIGMAFKQGRKDLPLHTVGKLRDDVLDSTSTVFKLKITSHLTIGALMCAGLCFMRQIQDFKFPALHRHTINIASINVCSELSAASGGKFITALPGGRLSETFCRIYHVGCCKR